MRDFPPDVRAYDGPFSGQRGSRATTSGPGPIREPTTGSPRAFLVWMMRQHGALFIIGLLVSTVWMVPQTVGPWIIGRAIDTGIVGGDQAALTRWIVLLAVVTVVGASSGVLYHTIIVREWLIAIYGVMLLVTRKTLQLGHVLPRRVPTGEVLSVAGSDGDQFGAFSEIATRAFSNLLAYLAVAAIVLTTSVPMGVLVLLAAPLLVVLGAPWLGPLHHWQALERTRNSELTSMGTDIVAGLRILRGIGGEDTFAGNYTTQSRRVRDAGVTAGRWLGAVEAVGVALSGAFVVALLWLGVRQVAGGQLTVGQLVSFLGYGLFLVQPMRIFVEFAQKWTRVSVSALKAVAVLEQRPPWQEPPVPRALTGGRIVDLASGLTIEPGILTMVVSAVPDDVAALADRLGRYLPHTESLAGPDEVPQELRGRAARRARAAKVVARREQGRRDEAEAGRAWGVSVGGVDLAQVPLDEVRRHIMVSEATPYVFAGTLRSALDPVGRLSRAEAERALHTAAAEDLFDALPDGWQGRLEERGRGLSGGQRQRLVLARAIAADPQVLVLVEPTSAVDAHTEAAIAARLGPHRGGRTTVVMTASPLLLHHADDIAFLEGGRVVARGRHADLLAGSTAYRNVVVRGAAAHEGPGDTSPIPGSVREEVGRR